MKIVIVKQIRWMLIYLVFMLVYSILLAKSINFKIFIKSLGIDTFDQYYFMWLLIAISMIILFSYFNRKLIFRKNVKLIILSPLIVLFLSNVWFWVSYVPAFVVFILAGGLLD